MILSPKQISHTRCLVLQVNFLSLSSLENVIFIYLFGVLCRFQHCTGHVTTGKWKSRGNQYIKFVRVLYCKLTNGKQLLAFSPRPQRWEARVLPLCHHGPLEHVISLISLGTCLVLSHVNLYGSSYSHYCAVMVSAQVINWFALIITHTSEMGYKQCGNVKDQQICSVHSAPSTLENVYFCSFFLSLDIDQLGTNLAL